MLSLVVPTLNEERLLPALLEAVLRAADPRDRADEVVVADGGSEDGTVELARAAGCVVVPATRGRGHQLAAGAARARGELLAFLHADARPFPGALARMRGAFEDRGVQACAFHQAVEADGRFYRLIERAAARRARRGWVYGDSGLVIRKEAYAAVGGYRPLVVFEDLDLSARLRAYAPVHLPEGARVTVSARRWRHEGALRATLRNWTLTGLWRIGVPPQHLARFYRPEPLPPAGLPRPHATA